MGSRIMHLLIANRIADYFSIEDRASFLLGGVAPDAVSTKDESHFFTGDASDYTRRVDFEKFLEKYYSFKNHAYVIGYYAHLIADDVWLTGFYLPWLKNRLENDANMHRLYHTDFKLLNGKLLDYYGMTKELQAALQKESKIIELQETPIKNVNEFILFVLGDMEYADSDLQAQLNVFTFQQIIGYIETSIDKAVKHIESNRLLN